MSNKPQEQVQDPLFTSRKFKALRKRALDRGIVFTLTLEQASALFNNATHCAYTGVPFSRTVQKHFKTFERVNNSKGYQFDNLIMVTAEANLLKADKTLEALEHDRDLIKHQLETVGNVVTQEISNDLYDEYGRFAEGISKLYDEFVINTNKIIEPVNESSAEFGSNRSVRFLKCQLNNILNEAKAGIIDLNLASIERYKKLTDHVNIGDDEMREEVELYDRLIEGIRKVEIEFGIREEPKPEIKQQVSLGTSLFNRFRGLFNV